MTRFPLFGAAVLAAISACGLVVLAFIEPMQVLQAWLAGFVWLTMIPVGALALLAIHRITGGDWGYALAPVLEPAARAILPAAILSLPVLILSGAIYHWLPPEMPEPVARYYMNAPLFAVRAVGAFILWSLFAWAGALRSTPPRASVALIILAVLTNIVPVDWVVSTKPGFYSSAFGFGFGIEEILAALGLCALLGPQGEEAGECRDVAGMIIATILGTIYFVYVQFAIIWYGNLPEKADWYVIRGIAPWPAIGGLAFALGAVLPFLALLNNEVRESELPLRIIGAGIVVGIALHVIWLIIPSFGTAALAPALLTITLMACLFTLWLDWNGIRWILRRQRAEAESRHG